MVQLCKWSYHYKGILYVKGGKNFFIFHVRGVKKNFLALWGGLKTFVMSFWIRPPPYCWVINDQPLTTTDSRSNVLYSVLLSSEMVWPPFRSSQRNYIKHSISNLLDLTSLKLTFQMQLRGFPSWKVIQQPRPTHQSRQNNNTFSKDGQTKKLSRGKRPIRQHFRPRWNVWNVWNVWRHSLPRWHKWSFVFKPLCTYYIVFDKKVIYIKHLCKFCIVLLINFVFKHLCTYHIVLDTNVFCFQASM